MTPRKAFSWLKEKKLIARSRQCQKCWSNMSIQKNHTGQENLEVHKPCKFIQGDVTNCDFPTKGNASKVKLFYVSFLKYIVIQLIINSYLSFVVNLEAYED